MSKLRQCQSSDSRPRFVSPALRMAFAATFMLGIAITSIGCAVPIYSARPERRIQQLLYTSENLRTMKDTWERFWFLDQPSQMTFSRTHGGVL